MAKAFASAADLEDKHITFARLSEHAWAYTAEGDPNTGVVITEDGVLVVDTQATPQMAADVIANELIVERGEADFKSEAGRFPRLFRGIDSIPGLTWPSIVFEEKLTVFMGGVEIQILHLGRGHTKGDTVVWLPAEGVLFSGDLVEFGATPYTGDAYLRDWPATLDRLAALQPKALVPGRGDALTQPDDIAKALSGTKAFITDLYESVAAGRAAGKSLKDVYRETYDRLAPKYGQWVIFDHCMPFDVARAYDEAGGKTDPEIWTAERDREMWAALEGEA